MIWNWTNQSINQSKEFAVILTATVPEAPDDMDVGTTFCPSRLYQPLRRFASSPEGFTTMSAPMVADRVFPPKSDTLQSLMATTALRLTAGSNASAYGHLEIFTTPSRLWFNAKLMATIWSMYKLLSDGRKHSSRKAAIIRRRKQILVHWANLVSPQSNANGAPRLIHQRDLAFR